MTMPRAFHVMVKPRGAICNCQCQYCYYLPKKHLYPGSNFRMTEELLESFTRRYIESQNAPQVNFTWQGGEPMLMGIEFYTHQHWLTALPGEVHLRSILRLDVTACEAFKQFFCHPEVAAGVEMFLGQVIAVLTLAVTDCPTRLHHNVKGSRHCHNNRSFGLATGFP